MLENFPKLELPCKRCGTLVCPPNFLCPACGTEMSIDWEKAKVIFEGGRTSADLGRDQILDAVVLSMVLRQVEETGKAVAVEMYPDRNLYILVDGVPVAFVRSTSNPPVYIVAIFPGVSGCDEFVSVDVTDLGIGKGMAYVVQRRGKDCRVTDEQVSFGEEGLCMLDSFFYVAAQKMFV